MPHIYEHKYKHLYVYMGQCISCVTHEKKNRIYHNEVALSLNLCTPAARYFCTYPESTSINLVFLREPKIFFF